MFVINEVKGGKISDMPLTKLFDRETETLSILKYYLVDPIILCLGDVNKLCVNGTSGPYEVVTEETNMITVQCLVDATPPADKYVWEKVIIGGNRTEVLTEDHSFVKVFKTMSSHENKKAEVDFIKKNFLGNPQGKVQRKRDPRDCLCLVNLQDIYRTCYSE